MSYRCEACQKVTEPGKPKLTWSVKRPDGQLAKQLAVCDECEFNLSRGVKLSSIQTMSRSHSPLYKEVSEAQRKSQLPPHLRFPARPKEVVIEEYSNRPVFAVAEATTLTVKTLGVEPIVIGPKRTIKLHKRKNNSKNKGRK